MIPAGRYGTGVLWVVWALLLGSSLLPRHPAAAAPPARSESVLPGPAADARAPAGCAPNWNVVASPDTGPGHNSFKSIAARAANDAWAVGFAQDPDFVYQTLIAHWDGAAWTVVPSPNQGANTNQLYGVAAVSASDAWAVGTAIGDSGYQTLIAHWDGTAWRIVPSPNTGAYTNNTLYSVAATGPNDVWAVGAAGIGALIEHWDGSAWTIVGGPSPSPYGNELHAVAVGGANDAWAVGYTTAGNGFHSTYTLHWNGTAWTLMASPNSGADHNYLTGLATISGNDSWAAGYTRNFAGVTQPLMLHWDGSAWSIVPTPPAGDYPLLRAVAARAGNDVWAIGVFSNYLGLQALFEHWDGTAWTIVPGDAMGTTDDDPYGITAAPGGEWWAAGADFDRTTRLNNTLVAHFTPQCRTPTPTPLVTSSATPPIPTATPTATPVCSGWSQVSNPIPPAIRSVFNAVTAGGPNDVWAVGHYHDPNGIGYPLIEHWDGSRWSIEATPALMFADIWLNSVVALAPDNVWTVGDYWDTTAQIHRTVAAHWDGASWTRIASPTPHDSTLLGVAAITPNDLWAVGVDRVSGGSTVLALHWTGTVWSVVPIAGAGQLNQVIALAANDVWAVGSVNNGLADQTLAVHWDGIAWSRVPTPNVRDENNYLLAMTAVAAGNAWAVGYHQVAGSRAQHPLILHWDGVTWALFYVPTDLTGSFSAVQALAWDDVWAVGSQTSAGLDYTYITHWDGYEWSAEPLPAPGRTGLHGLAAAAPHAIWGVGANNQAAILHYSGPCGTATPTPPTPQPTRTPAPSPTLPPDCTTGWQHIPSPAQPGARWTLLYGVTALSANDAWAVGAYDILRYQTFILHWDGAQWLQLPSPNPGSDHDNLYSVSGVAANDVWAVGTFNNFGGPNNPLILHWDGYVWTPTFVSNLGVTELHAVVAVAANDVWAVGDGIFHWDGVTWQVVPAPTIGTLHSLAAVAPNDIWAAGYYLLSGGHYQTLLEHWDGSRWQIVPSPNGDPDGDFFEVVAASGANDAWAAGFRTQHWDGITWRITPNPLGNTITGLTMTAPDDVWIANGGLAHWDGSQWSGNQALGTIAALFARTRTDVWAVGGGTLNTFVQRFTGPCATVTPAGTPTRAVTATRSPSVTSTRPPAGTPGPPSSTPSPPLLTGTPTPTPPGCPIRFTDVDPTNPFYPFIHCLACRGIVGGYLCGAPGEPCPGTYFRPNTAVTRGQVSKIVSQSAGFADPIPSSRQTFADVAPGSTFHLWIERLSTRGIIGGYPCGGPFEPCVAPGNRPYFRPNNDVTRGQLSKIVAGAAGWTETPTRQTFQDVPPGSTFYLYVERLAAHGTMNGYPCGGPTEPCIAPANRPYFRPGNPATRGQAAKIIANTFAPNCRIPAATRSGPVARQPVQP